MSYIGKEYKFDREENFVEFINSLGLPEEQTKIYLNFKPVSTLLKEGDGYKYINTTPNGTREVSFKSGVEFDDKINNVDTKTLYTVDGNNVTQTISAKGTTITFKRTYTDNELVVEITSNKWDGVARRYYKA